MSLNESRERELYIDRVRVREIKEFRRTVFSVLKGDVFGDEVGSVLSEGGDFPLLVVGLPKEHQRVLRRVEGEDSPTAAAAAATRKPLLDETLQDLLGLGLLLDRKKL